MEALHHALPTRIQVERLGADIVNSISIHLLHGTDTSEEDEVVAVLTNNDHTVRIYSLTKEAVIRSEKFDFPMNHATISPDGTIMMIVGDKEVAYFYQKIDTPDVRNGWSRTTTHGSWVLLREVWLHKPASHESSMYFTTTWSPTGRLCATASEDGAVVLIDVDALADEGRDPIVSIMFSSRPDSKLGGVRAMCFAPYPWDLLLWNEDRGRMCIADLRNGIHMRQVIELDRHAVGVSTVEPLSGSLLPADRTPGSWGARSQRTSDVARDIERLNQAAQRYRRSRESAATASETNQQGLTEEEQQILDGLRSSRQREEEIRNRERESNTRVTPRSINYSSAEGTPRQNTQGATVLGSIRNYLQEHGGGSPLVNIPTVPQYPAITGTPARTTTGFGDPGQTAGASLGDPWRIIEAAMQRTGPLSSTTGGNNTLSSVPNPANDNQGGPALALFTNLNDNPSPRTQVTLPNLRQMRDTLRLDSEAAYRDYRQRVAELDAASSWRSRSIQLTSTDAALRGRLAELEVEIEATERQRINNESLILAAETETAAVRRRLDAEIDTANAAVAAAAAEREVSDRRRRLLDLAAASAEVNAERRRRMRAAGLATNSGSGGARNSALTTRGEAVLAREERERTHRSVSSASPSIEALREARELSLHALRDLRPREGGVVRLSRATRPTGAGDTAASSAESESETQTTGIAWGHGSTV